MNRAFRSERLKIWRPSMIIGGVVTMVGFAVLAVILTLAQLGSGRGANGLDLTAGQVAASTGFAHLLANSATFLGVIALAVCAVCVGTEYTNGTLRNLLIRQPDRLRFLAGKLLAVASFVALSAALACLAAFVTALVAAPMHGIATTAWSTGTGVRSIASATGDVLLSVLAWGMIGATIALAFRSTTAAIAGGLAYLLVAENLLSAAWSAGKQWLPGQVINALARGGTTDVAYGTALAITTLYVALALMAAGALLRRRDVAA